MIEERPHVLRQIYFDAWHKAQQQHPLTDLEKIIVDIIKRHPEYHPIFSKKKFEGMKEESFNLDHNPFFHLALHVTIAEQIQADRPAGIRAVYFNLLKQFDDQMKAEHHMMECLARLLVESFNNNLPVDEQAYLTSL